MDFNEDLNKIENQISNQEKANAIVELSKQPINIVKSAVSNNIAKKVNSDESVQKRIDESTNKLIDSGLKTVENEADKAESDSNQGKLQSYFNEHKEELKTAGIDEPTYLEDMKRGVACHRKWSNIHWALFGWWMTGIRTMFMKAKPFKIWLNIMAILGCLVITGGAIWGIIALINLIA